MTNEADVIERLLSVEKEASTLLQDARKRADEKVIASRAQAEEMFHNEYVSIAHELDEQENAEHERIVLAHEKAFSSYRDSLVNIPKDTKAFESVLEKVLF